jgi:hypothetical protein
MRSGLVGRRIREGRTTLLFRQCHPRCVIADQRGPVGPSPAGGIRWIPNSGASDPYRKLARSVGAMLLFAFAVCCGAATWSFFVAISFAPPHVDPFKLTFWILLGLLLVGVAVYSGVWARRTMLPGLASIGFADEEVVLRWEQGPATSERWTNPNFRMVIIDSRERPQNSSNPSPCQLIFRGRIVGPSTEGCDALLEKAREHSLKVDAKRVSSDARASTRYRVSSG